MSERRLRYRAGTRYATGHLVRDTSPARTYSGAYPQWQSAWIVRCPAASPLAHWRSSSRHWRSGLSCPPMRASLMDCALWTPNRSNRTSSHQRLRQTCLTTPRSTPIQSTRRSPPTSSPQAPSQRMRTKTKYSRTYRRARQRFGCTYALCARQLDSSSYRARKWTQRRIRSHQQNNDRVPRGSILMDSALRPISYRSRRNSEPWRQSLRVLSSQLIQLTDCLALNYEPLTDLSAATARQIYIAALSSGDPELLAWIGGSLNTREGSTVERLGPYAASDLSFASFVLAGCDLGADCSPNSLWFQFNCADNAAACMYDNLEAQLLSLSYPPRAHPYIQRERRNIVLRIRSGQGASLFAPVSPPKS